VHKLDSFQRFISLNSIDSVELLREVFVHVRPRYCIMQCTCNNNNYYFICILNNSWTMH